MTNTNDGAGCLALFLLFLILIPLFVVIGGLITMFAWNVGVVALVAACGGAVAKIGFWTAVAINFGISIIGGIFRRPTAS